MDTAIDISEFDYTLPDQRIARFPLDDRSDSKLLLYRGGEIGENVFRNVADFLPSGSVVVFNNTKVVRARLLFHKSTGARIEIFCLEPHQPADYERAFAVTGECSWRCIVGNSKKWKQGELVIEYDGGHLSAERETEQGSDIIRFTWNSDHTFGQLLELLGRTPIPPYLCRESEEIDTVRYQTVYSRFEGSVAAPTAGLHFTDELLGGLSEKGFDRADVTLHVGAGTFLPVKAKNARDHHMHTEFFQVDLATVEKLAIAGGQIISVGTTSVRTLESLAVLGERVLMHGDADPERAVGQWEAYQNGADDINGEPLAALAEWMRRTGVGQLHSSTQIMITPGYRWRTVRGLITNFHQPQSTLLLLISAFVGEERWKEIYGYALANDFRFLSYGDSSLLLPPAGSPLTAHREHAAPRGSAVKDGS